MEDPHKKYCIYFIAEIPFSARVKLGKTGNIDKKLQSLQEGNPNKLMVYRKVIVQCTTQMNAVECFLRNLLRGECVAGDWFALELHKVDEICDLLESLLKTVVPCQNVSIETTQSNDLKAKAGLTQKVSFAGQQIVINLTRELPPEGCKLL